MIAADVQRLMDLYPKIFFACHTRHVPDPETRQPVSTHQAQILDHLDEHQPTGLGDLARHMGVTPGTMSIAVDRLTSRGYVRRDRDSADRRRVNLRLTPAGERIRQASTVLDATLVQAMLEQLGDEERETALAGLVVLAEAAQHIERGKQLYGLKDRRLA